MTINQLFDWRIFGLALLAAGLSYVLTCLARVVAPKLGFMDKPDGVRKVHRRPTPLMGGVALFVAVLGAVLLCRSPALISPSGFSPSSCNLCAVLFSAGLFCLLGLADDKWTMRPRTKLLGQAVACIPFLVLGRSIETIGIFGFEIPLGSLGLLVTVLWLITCVNVINLLDGLDGLAATVGLIAAVALALLSLVGGRVEVAILAVVLAGSLCGFLLHNWPPAKIFLGDSGSMTIGLLIGAMSIDASLKTSTAFMMLPLVALLSIPIFDATVAVLRRRLDGKGVGAPDREHIHHQLRARGLTELKTLLLISCLCLFSATASAVSIYLRSDLIALTVCGIIVGTLLAGRLFGHRELGRLLHRLQSVATGAVVAEKQEAAPVVRFDGAFHGRQKRSALAAREQAAEDKHASVLSGPPPHERRRKAA
jgi:UDP-GlcNAc:undecaprenyl-phosphate GlcNAc-1-phosphate transferase